ncbi:DNA repair protein RadA [Arenicella chitinivorans]|uniref:DNA repair protein RadA n=1 Tax=Arenicella chitinivorans TaxID=1329800 RepID=A0A918VJV0_9GAMM|nr:DNA repair protein RadA [Arenicella chitinivorans]GHA01697.1 DNA repair protein RadA [Arenicella chitinivorans]
MAKAKTVYACTSCGAQFPKWTGQCQDCGDWNTLQEELGIAKSIPSSSNPKAARFEGFAPKADVQKLPSVSTQSAPRSGTGLKELDRVLGGGLVPGSIILLGGDPGIGKSTLILQSLALLSEHKSTLYVTGEESAEQVALRAQRLGVQDADLALLADNQLESILDVAIAHKPDVLVVDSIQTLYTDTLQSAPGSVAQVRETASRLVRYGKQTKTIVILVGHVTKEGALAGPRVLEHMVDTVLYFEGEQNSTFRLIRAIKNRFGAVNEIGVFAMTDAGLKEVTNPSAMFIKRTQDDATGSVVLVSQEGTRPLLVEVQALVDQSSLANPRRVTVGLDNQRLSMLLAVVNRHAGFSLYDQDVFVNVIGGVKVHEPAADLAILLAVLSSFRNRGLPPGLAVFGEIGLTGEVRPVQRGLDRIKEVEKLGFTRLIMPQGNKSGIKSSKLDIVTVNNLEQAVRYAFDY